MLIDKDEARILIYSMYDELLYDKYMSHKREISKTKEREMVRRIEELKLLLKEK